MAYENDHFVGAAGLRYSELHFRMPAIYIVVSPGYRKKGIGSELHKNLIKLFPLKSNEIGFAGNSYDVQKVAISFMSKMGYDHLLDCHCLTIDLDKFQSEKLEYEVSFFSDFSAKHDSIDNVTKFLTERYIEEHFWNPPHAIDHEIWDDYKSEDISKTSVLIMKDERILGVSEAHDDFKPFDDSQFAIGWAYADKHFDEVTILKNLYSTQFELAKDLGTREAYMEIDSTESTAEEILKWLPIKGQQIYKKYCLRL